MSERKIDSGTVSFLTEGRLLQELGERLVASPEVALVELLKNAYDADSPSCDVKLQDHGKALSVSDLGHGMTLEEFESRWMTIATSHKTLESVSPMYGRRRTGQKGIGRFAVRYLGDHLTLITVAEDKKRRKKTKVIAEFDWPSLDKAPDIKNAKIPYRLLQVDPSTPSGTTLFISGQKHEASFITSSNFRTQVLKIVSPLEGLDRGRFNNRVEARHDHDPGFRVMLPGNIQTEEDDLDLARKVLDRCWARLTIDLSGKHAVFKLKFNVIESESVLRIPFRSSISQGMFADIRFFPRREGIFKGQGLDGRKAWEWVRENVGVAVVDHGFRTKPYGFGDNDWLLLDADSAHSSRDWRSEIAKKYFPISSEIKARPGENPALNVPSNFQLVGAVFVESAPASLSETDGDLTPSMDREGFLKNAASNQLVEAVRAGLEFLAVEDKKLLQREAERRAKEATNQARADFRSAIQYIEDSTTLTRGDKTRLVLHYSELAKKLVEVEQYDREARRKLETMSLLGAVAGFMTHEATRIISGLKEALEKLRPLASRDPSLKKILDDVQESYEAFCGHMDYTSAFINAVHIDKIGSFKSASQIKRVIDKFGQFARDRGIAVECKVDSALEAPPIATPIYSGVLLNLYTNALKAILAAESSGRKPKIVFRGWNDQKWHVIEVLDTGVGIPPDLHQRVFDPLFTTTSRLNNPLGSGMGLGLSLVKQLVTQVKGRIEVVDAPPGFSTCFRLELPRN